MNENDADSDNKEEDDGIDPNIEMRDLNMMEGKPGLIVGENEIIATLYEIVTEAQEGYVDKCILSPEKLESFVNCIWADGSRNQANWIDFEATKHTKITPICLFGERSEVIAQLSHFKLLANDLMKKLQSTTKRLHPGLYAILPKRIPKCPKHLTIVLFYWCMSGDFQDNAADMVALFARICHEIGSTVCFPLTSVDTETYLLQCSQKAPQRGPKGRSMQYKIRETQKNEVLLDDAPISIALKLNNLDLRYVKDDHEPWQVHLIDGSQFFGVAATYKLTDKTREMQRQLKKDSSGLRKLPTEYALSIEPKLDVEGLLLLSKELFPDLAKVIFVFVFFAT
ncbi:hypothetical protein RFI_16319 [Reticulomyxa filosa]|uniref:Uncharacterized protein n=1 Tax=Reticulomyxa filosa TaxID=46433 RepID=X6N4H8_RETFI|nr:hypothetical protein RFI_16319 [Reticulomyxa filosa]|eukprot:ETO20891.1 hypothetical protein RFI_16319 [Reticulomyxa filosa]